MNSLLTDSVIKLATPDEIPSVGDDMRSAVNRAD